MQPQFQALADSEGPYSAEAKSYLDNTPAAISAVRTAQEKKAADAAFQRTMQTYQQALNANDKSALEAARNNFQSIMQGGGSHAGEAQKYVDEISAKLVALNLSVANAAVRAVIQRYAQAFDQRSADALRAIWPTIGDQKYKEFKLSFEDASSIHVQVEIQSIVPGADGTTATVTVLMSMDYTPKNPEGKKPMRRNNQGVFQLANSNGIWIIKDVQ